MPQDFIAELEGYRAELARYDRADRADRADAVREQMAKVTDAIRVEADKLDAKAKGHVDDGQDVLAAQVMVEARRLRRALADAGEQETATDKTPRQTAVVKKARA